MNDVERSLLQMYERSARSRRLVKVKRRPRRIGSMLVLASAVTVAAAVVVTVISSTGSQPAAAPVTAGPQAELLGGPSGRACAVTSVGSRVYVAVQPIPAQSVGCSLFVRAISDWQPELIGHSVSALATDRVGAVYAGTSAGEIWRSDSHGWQRVFAPAQYQAAVTALLVTDDGLFAAAHGLLHSMDGVTWRDLSPTLVAAAPGLLTRFVITGIAQHGPDVLIAVSGTDPASGLWATRDNGGSWRRIAVPGLQAMAATDAVIVVATSRQGSARPAAYVSRDDGATWSAAGAGAESAQFTANGLLATPSAAVYGGTESSGLLRFDGTRWVTVSTDPHFVVGLQLVDGTLYFAASDGAWRLRSP